MKIKEEQNKDMSVYDAPAGYLLREHERITDMMIYENEMGHNRFQFYISIATALGAVLMVLLQTTGMSGHFFLIAGLALVGLWVLGMTLLARFVRRAISKIEYLRALAKIGRYFVANEPELEKYLYWDTYDDHPKFIYHLNPTASNLIVLVGIFKGFFLAVGAVALVHFFGPEAGGLHLLLVGGLFFLINLLGDEVYRRHRCLQAEEFHRARVDFPAPEGSYDSSEINYALKKKQIEAARKELEKKRQAQSAKTTKVRVTRSK